MLFMERNQIVQTLASNGAHQPLAVSISLRGAHGCSQYSHAERPYLSIQVSGKVIGVNVAMLRDFGGSNFAIPVRYAKPLLSR